MREQVKLAYPYGAMLVHPHRDENGEETAVRYVFEGRFGRRKLRKMIREATPLKDKTHIEWAIDNLITKMVPANFKEAVRAIYEDGKDA